MAKSKRRRRQDRAKRVASAQQRARRRQEDQELDRMDRPAGVLYDPEAPVEAVAVAIMGRFAPGPVPAGLAGLLAERRPAGDVAAVAEALDVLTDAEGGGPSVTSLTFRAHVAGLRGEHGRARALMDAAFAVVDDPAVELRLAANLLELGRVADALDLLGARVADTAGDDVAAATHEDAWETAHRRGHGQGLAGQCPCSSGRAWTGCCRPREEEWLVAFADRSSIYELRTAVVDYMDRTPYGPAIEAHVLQWLREADAASRDPEEVEALSRLAYEHAWLVAEPEEGRSYQEHDGVLSALAADPATPAPIAAAARIWRDGLRYGLWLVADPRPSPGIGCIDLLTGRELYLAVAPEQAEGLARWSVLVGAIVPLHGAWRTTGTFVRVSPAEGDSLCEATQRATEEFLDDLRRHAGLKRGRQAAMTAPRETPPHNVHTYLDDEADPVFAGIAGKVLASGLPRLLARLHQSRSTLPALCNSDGEPIMMIKARIRVDDITVVAKSLTDHPDFSDEPDEPGRWTWLGEAMPAEQRAAMLAQVRAQLRAEGRGDVQVDDDDQPGRWVRGTVTADGDQLAVEVNSQARLDRLVEILATMGERPTIVDQSRFEPSQDLAWPAGHRSMGGGRAVPPAGEGWERAWLDEPVPALHGRTPRATASSPDWALLESLLRQFEYDADTAGRPSPDIAWLREQLKMPADRFR